MTMFSDCRYRCVAQSTLYSVDGTARFENDYRLLTDGHPSTRCAIRWPMKETQAATDNVDIVVRIVPVKPSEFPMEAPEARIFCIDGLVGIPVGTAIQLLRGSSPNTATMTRFAEIIVAEQPNGRLGAWHVLDPGFGWHAEYFAFRILNKVIVSPGIPAGAIVQIGEVFAAPVEEWPAAEFEIKPVDLSLSNEASDGTIRRVKRTPQRQVTVTIPPRNYNEAIADWDGTTLQDFLYRMIAADYVALIVRPYPRGIPGVLWHLMNATAMLACVQDVGGLKFNAANNNSAPLTLTFKESL